MTRESTLRRWLYDATLYTLRMQGELLDSAATTETYRYKDATYVVGPSDTYILNATLGVTYRRGTT